MILHQNTRSLSLLHKSRIFPSGSATFALISGQARFSTFLVVASDLSIETKTRNRPPSRSCEAYTQTTKQETRETKIKTKSILIEPIYTGLIAHQNDKTIEIVKHTERTLLAK